MRQNMKFFLQQKFKSIKIWTQLSNPVPENKIQNINSKQKLFMYKCEKQNKTK